MDRKKLRSEVVMRIIFIAIPLILILVCKGEPMINYVVMQIVWTNILLTFILLSGVGKNGYT